jgi:hypothetical protein
MEKWLTSKKSNIKPSKKHGFARTFWNSPAKNVPKKNLSYPQAKVRYPKLNPYGDADHDGVPNWRDCKPFNKNQQGLTNLDKVRLKAFAKKKYVEAGMDPQHFDLDAHTDSSLSYSEAKNEIEGKIMTPRAIPKNKRDTIMSGEQTHSLRKGATEQHFETYTPEDKKVPIDTFYDTYD